MSGDDLGDRMKAYEAALAGQRLMPLLPAVVRLDGKGFSKFTRGLQRPYDERMSKLMVEVTRLVTDEASARCGSARSPAYSPLKTHEWLSEARSLAARRALRAPS